MSLKLYYQYCVVPCCENNTKRTPDKLFIPVPRQPEMRKQWLKLARRDWKQLSLKTTMYFCEDHFDLPQDMENYMQYRIKGSVKRIRMKKGCLPSRFACQPDRKRTAPLSARAVIIKKQRMEIVEEALKEAINKEMSVCIKSSAIPRLKENAVPSICAWTKEDPMKEKLKKKQAKRDINCGNKKAETELPFSSHLLTCGTEVTEEITCQTEVKIEAICETEVTEETTCQTEVTEGTTCQTEVIEETTCQTEVKVETACQSDVEIETTYIGRHTKDVGNQSSLCNCTSCDSLPTTSNECRPNIFQIENLRDQKFDSVINFYTGFDNYQHFMLVFNLFGEEVNNLKYYPSMEPWIKKRPLTPCNEFYLTLIKLRRDMCNTELSFHFGVCDRTVSRVFITWVNYLYCKLNKLQVWVPKDIIDENLMLQNKCNLSTVIIDCTEIKIEKPKNPVSQQSTVSTDKSANTLKVLVGISASGCVTYVSDAYAGSISDKQIFEICGIISKLNKKDIIQDDRGFNIQDVMSHIDVTVNTPQFPNKDECQFETDQLRTSKKLSSHRILVERVIGLAKTYKILTGTLGSHLVPLGGRIIFVCFMLVNFRKKIS